MISGLHCNTRVATDGGRQCVPGFRVEGFGLGHQSSNREKHEHEGHGSGAYGFRLLCQLPILIIIRTTSTLVVSVRLVILVGHNIKTSY